MNLIANIGSALMFIMATIILTDGMAQNNLSVNMNLTMVPVHYSVKLTIIDLKTITTVNKYKSTPFYGGSSINVNILNLTRTIGLHKINLSVSNAILIARDGTIYKVAYALHNSETDILNYYFEDMLYPALYTLKMNFVSQVRENSQGIIKGLIQSNYISKDGKMWSVVTNVLTNRTRQLFPCWDEPQLRATFNISVVHNRNFTALSNMPIRNQSNIDDEIWTHFHITPQISTNYVVIVVSNYSPIRIRKNISLWCKECSGKHSFIFAKEVIKNVTSHLESKFERIRISKMDHVAIPFIPQKGISKLGLIFHREEDIIYNEKSDPFMHKIEVGRSIAFNIAYQWFGNVVSPTWWTQHWLHDGLATLFGEEAIEQFFNNSGIVAFFVVHGQYESLQLDSYFDMNPLQTNIISENHTLSRFPHHIKVPIILRMLQETITYALFEEGVNTYLHKYAFHSVTPSEFWSIQDDVAKTSFLQFVPSDLQVWLEYKHHPVLYWMTIDNLMYSPYSKVEQKFDTDYGKWWLHTKVIIKSHITQKFNLIGFWLTPQKPYYEVDYNIEDNSIISDIRQAAYYRINYETKHWSEIANYLNSGEHVNKISVINRAKIIDDAFHFVMTRQLNISIFWQLTKYLSKETDYVAWYSMIKVLEYMSNVFPLSMYQKNFSYVKEKVKEFLVKSLDILGYHERSMENEFTKCLRRELIKWACTLEDPKCLQMATIKLENHLKEPASIREDAVLSQWSEWLYCKGFANVDTNTWPYTGEMWLNTTGRYVNVYSCSRDESFIYLLYETLKSIHSENLLIETKEDIKFRIDLFQSIAVRHSHRRGTLEVILRNIMYLKPMEISNIAALVIIINHVYSSEQLQRINHMLRYEELISLKQIESKVFSKINERALEIKRQIEHFQIF